MTIEYERPAFLKKTLEPADYTKWLNRKAQSLVHRDRRRWPKTVIERAKYKKKIHDAVVYSEGRDFYTGEPLSWCLVGKYNGSDAQKEGVEYRRRFGNLPTVDHENPTAPDSDFRICALRTNDCKSDLLPGEFREFCQKVLRYSGQETSAGSMNG